MDNKTRDRSERFVELGQKRMNKLITNMRLVGNLSDKSNYEYSDEQKKKIISTIDMEFKYLKQRINNGQSRKAKGFTL